jgi:hypothetical protein
MGRNIVEEFPVEANLAARRKFEACEHHQAGSLARARRSEQTQEFPPVDIQVERFNDKRLAVVSFSNAPEIDNDFISFLHHYLHSTPLA